MENLIPCTARTQPPFRPCVFRSPRVSALRPAPLALRSRRSTGSVEVEAGGTTGAGPRGEADTGRRRVGPVQASSSAFGGPGPGVGPLEGGIARPRGPLGVVSAGGDTQPTPASSSPASAALPLEPPTTPTVIQRPAGALGTGGLLGSPGRRSSESNLVLPQSVPGAGLKPPGLDLVGAGGGGGGGPRAGGTHSRRNSEVALGGVLSAGSIVGVGQPPGTPPTPGGILSAGGSSAAPPAASTDPLGRRSSIGDGGVISAGSAPRVAGAAGDLSGGGIVLSAGTLAMPQGRRLSQPTLIVSAGDVLSAGGTLGLGQVGAGAGTSGVRAVRGSGGVGAGEGGTGRVLPSGLISGGAP
jgi:hypothetical protein